MHRLLATCTCSSDTCRLVCNCDYCMPTASFALASRLLSPVSSLMTMATRVTRSKTAKSAKMSDKAPGSTKISSYFEPVKTTDRKRYDSKILISAVYQVMSVFKLLCHSVCLQLSF